MTDEVEWDSVAARRFARRVNELEAENADLRAQLAAAEEDTKRLDWLDRHYVEIGTTMMATTQTDHDGNHGEVELWALCREDRPTIYHEKIRGTIDAARVSADANNGSGE